ncbi:hypothetical protein SteCoe_10339 [Stentor coeruleus]|uniref:Cyclic nucleotide-binding domain-containing protein n=1 Tax=Stentor coeruleus TaxID=5963 RepID=A0A1R2CFX1_9CILI|nr:hypothetical protein SteCoe_10339 [Stentor coeruleus]
MKESIFDWNKAREILSIPNSEKNEDHHIELSNILIGANFLSKLKTKYTHAMQFACVKSFKLMKFIKGHYLYEKGDFDNNYYIILKGQASFSHTTSKHTENPNLSSDSSESSLNEKSNTLRPRNRLVNITSDMMNDYSRRRYSVFSDSDNENFKKTKLEQESTGLMDFIIQGDFSGRHAEIKSLTVGDDFGYECFFNEKPRYINALAKTNLYVAILSKKEFLRIFQETKDKITHENCEFLHNVSLFHNWPRANILKISNLFKTKILYKDQYLYKQFEAPSAVYFIKKGDFKITQYIKKNSDTQTICDQKKGFKFRVIPSHNKSMDLVIKSEKEILGAEEILSGNDYRQFSCMCISATAEVLYVTKGDFISKLVRTDICDENSKNFYINKEWLEKRSNYIDDFACKTIDVVNKKKEISLLGQSNLEALSFDGNFKDVLEHNNALTSRKGIRRNFLNMKIPRLINSVSNKKKQERKIEPGYGIRDCDGQYIISSTFLKYAVCPPSKKKNFKDKILHVKKDLIRGVPPSFLMNSRIKVVHNKSKSQDATVYCNLNKV